MPLYSPDEQSDLFEAYVKDDRARIPTGYKSIDDVLRGGGLAPGDVTMLLGRSEVGKTFFLCNLLRNMAHAGVLFASLEMTVEQVFGRLACLAYDLDPRRFESSVKMGFVAGEEHMRRFREEFPKLYVYKPSSVEGAGFDEFSRAVDDYTRVVGEPPRVFALDFLGLVKRDQYAGAEQQRIPRLAAQAERWADSVGVSLIVLHQTGRSNEGDPQRRNHGHHPLTMEDAMYGGEQNADYMLGLYRPEREPPPQDVMSAEYDEWHRRVQATKGLVFVQLLKNRHGPRTIESQYPGFPFRWQWPSGRMDETTWQAQAREVTEEP